MSRPPQNLNLIDCAGRGMTVVDLINVGDKTKGYADIVAWRCRQPQGQLLLGSDGR